MTITENERNLTQSQKLMVFVLSLSVFGLAELVTQIIPTVSLGPIDINVAYFAFIPVTLAILFDPLSVALGCVTGSIVFSSLLMGDFGGIGELEGFIQQSVAIFIAGVIVSNPLSKVQITISAITLVAIDKLISGVVDTLKVVVGVEQFEAVQGLPQSVFALEGIAFFTDLLIAGVIFGVLPALFLVPRLYGKIEPLLGIKPRVSRPESDLKKVMKPGFIILVIVLFAASAGVSVLDAMDIKFGVWEPDFIGQFGDSFVYIGIGIAAVVLIAVILFLVKRKKTYELE